MSSKPANKYSNTFSWTTHVKRTTFNKRHATGLYHKAVSTTCC